MYSTAGPFRFRVLEVIVGDRVVAAGDRTAADVERCFTSACGVAHERRILTAYKPVFARLGDLRRDVLHDATMELDVVRHPPASDDVSGLLLRIAENHRIAPRHDDFGRVAINDAVADENGLLATNARLFSSELEGVRLRVEHRLIALVPSRGVALSGHQGLHH